MASAQCLPCMAAASAMSLTAATLGRRRSGAACVKTNAARPLKACTLKSGRRMVCQAKKMEPTDEDMANIGLDDVYNLIENAEKTVKTPAGSPSSSSQGATGGMDGKVKEIAEIALALGVGAGLYWVVQHFTGNQ
eukprot:jgi/Mesvir1/15913/Mv08237-RA.1